MNDLVSKAQESLGIILPQGVHFQVAAVGDFTKELWPEEKEQSATYGTKRLFEFATSRVLARCLLTEMGVKPQAILSGAQREPLWPDGVIGTISHSKGVVIVALAKSDKVAALGCDFEARPNLKKSLWPKVLSATEGEFLGRLPVQKASRMALLFFSAKEAFYKAQFPLTRVFLGFDALEIERQEAHDLIFRVTTTEPGVLESQAIHLEMKGLSTPSFALAVCYLGPHYS